MTDYDQVDFFTDATLLEDPYPYFEHLRSKCPIAATNTYGVLAVTGWDEASEIYRDHDTFSSCNSVIGPFAEFPVPLEGDDVSATIDAHRDLLPMNEHMVTMDPPMHTQERALLMRLLTPKRLQENEEFMWRVADRQLDEFLANGKCEFISEYAQPFAMFAVADVLGVPEADQGEFRKFFGLSQPPGMVNQADVRDDEPLNKLDSLDEWFSTYIEDRRANPRHDILTDLAQGTYPDGSIPPVVNVVRSATFLFAAGQETTAKLLANCVQHLCEKPELQDELRSNRDLIPEFIEEALRLESPVKADFRMTRRTTSVGGVEIKAGTPVMLLNGAANRDPRRFECPEEFRIERPNSREHLAFGRGHHSCPGGPLARVEARVSLNRILDRTRDLRLSAEHHGTDGNWHFDYEPTWILRGLTKLHIEFTPVEVEQ
ncbi:MAG: cytochrome P450 [Microthrixaceae bacterium]|nr:cytochrome P450 [Microthrixaceae bacterium]